MTRGKKREKLQEMQERDLREKPEGDRDEVGNLIPMVLGYALVDTSCTFTADVHTLSIYDRERWTFRHTRIYSFCTQSLTSSNT
jgi:hypothetical protein